MIPPCFTSDERRLSDVLQETLFFRWIKQKIRFCFSTWKRDVFCVLASDSIAQVRY